MNGPFASPPHVKKRPNPAVSGRSASNTSPRSAALRRYMPSTTPMTSSRVLHRTVASGWSDHARIARIPTATALRPRASVPARSASLGLLKRTVRANSTSALRASEERRPCWRTTPRRSRRRRSAVDRTIETPIESSTASFQQRSPLQLRGRINVDAHYAVSLGKRAGQRPVPAA